MGRPRPAAKAPAITPPPAVAPPDLPKKNIPYSEETGLEVCDFVAGGASLNTVALRADMPTVRTVLKWLRERPEFAESFGIAMRERGHSVIESMMEVVKKVESGDIDPYSAKVILDSYKWLAAKFLPENYGNKVEDSTTSITVQVTEEESRY